MKNPYPIACGAPAGDAFNTFIHFWKGQHWTSDGKVESWEELKNNALLSRIWGVNSNFTWVLDVQTMQFVFISDQVAALLENEAEQAQAKGLSWLNHLLHPDDQPTMWHLNRMLWQHILTLPLQKRINCQAKLDYRLRKANGTYIRLLEQTCIWRTDPAGNITHLLGMVSDISHWKKSELLIASVSSPDKEACLVRTAADIKPNTNPLLNPWTGNCSVASS